MERPHFRQGAMFYALALVLLVWGVSSCGGNDSVGIRTRNTADSSTTGSSLPSKITGDQAIAKVEGLTAEVSGISRIEAKLVTVGDVLAAGASDTSLSGVDDSEPVWAVAVAGKFKPSFALVDEILPWAVIVFDANTGNAQGSMAGMKGAWPPYFDSLPGTAVIGETPGA